MKQVFPLTLSAVFAAVLLVGCSDGSTLVEADQGSAATSSDLVALGKAGASGPSASGHTNFTLEGELQTFSFQARTRADGSVTGTWQAKSRGQNTTARGSIDCLSVDGNRAFLNGIIASINEDSPFIGLLPVGSRVWFGVEDNGEGGESVDAWTDLFAAGDDTSCPDFGESFLPNEAGNIQVKP